MRLQHSLLTFILSINVISVCGQVALKDCTVIVDDYPSIIILYDCNVDGKEELSWEIPTAHSTGSCGPIKLTQTAGYPLGYVNPLGEYPITYFAQAGDNQTMSIVTTPFSFTVLVKKDEIAPVISNCGNIGIQYVKPVLNASGEYVSTIPDVTNLINATDNCSVVSITQSPQAGSILKSSSKTIKVFAKDSTGNTTTCEVIVTKRTSKLSK